MISRIGNFFVPIVFIQGQHKSDLIPQIKAEPLSRRASEIGRRAFGERHPDYATCLNNLGALYATMGDLSSASSLRLAQAIALS